MNLHLLHHWLISMRGGEKVFEQFCYLFPDAPVHTLICNKNALSEPILQHDIHTSFLSSLPGAEEHYKLMLPFYPAALKNHQVKADFILSSDASLIKGMQNSGDVPHVCYCHSPPRYLWDLQHEYLERMSSPKKMIFKKLTPYLRRFDAEAANSVDHFIANSEFVKQRISRIYNRDAEVIYPPVNLSAFDPGKESEDYYLIVSALVPYKRIELAVRAFNRMKKKLIVIGYGSEKEKLEAMASDNVNVMGPQPFDVVVKAFEGCRAFVFPGVEDFGITPLEAQAAGKPVIAFRRGGVLETVLEGLTGLFFDEQTVESLTEAVHDFEKRSDRFKSEACRKQAENFSPEKFRSKIKAFLSRTYPTLFRNFQWGC